MVTPISTAIITWCCVYRYVMSNDTHTHTHTHTHYWPLTCTFWNVEGPETVLTWILLEQCMYALMQKSCPSNTSLIMHVWDTKLLNYGILWEECMGEEEREGQTKWVPICHLSSMPSVRCKIWREIEDSIFNTYPLQYKIKRWHLDILLTC